MAIGSRYVPGGGVRNWPLIRRAMSRFACLLARPITPARDATSGYFLVRRHAVEGVKIAAGGFKICLELLVRGRVESVVEVPYEFSDRAAGESKMSWREATGLSVAAPRSDAGAPRPVDAAALPAGEVEASGQPPF